jgi:hypothetical protein
MPEPAFLVDGVMEQRILSQICPNKPVRRLNCNGTDVPLEIIVKKVEFHIRLLNNRYFPIVILLDREKRSKTCNEIVAELSKLLNDRGFAGQFVVGVVDRCIENWILADWGSVIEQFGFPPAKKKVLEGTQGKTELKRLLPAGVLYHEPTWGADLFLCCRAENIYQNSASFRYFFDQLSLPCAWLSSVAIRFCPVYD